MDLDYFVFFMVYILYLVPVVDVAFQSVFRSQMQQNDIFFIF